MLMDRGQQLTRVSQQSQETVRNASLQAVPKLSGPEDPQWVCTQI